MPGMPKNFTLIQILRAVAALMVVAFHLPAVLGFRSLDVRILSGGVDVFFVISGAVMMLATMGKRNDVPLFLRQRILRVAPMYWIATFGLVMLWIAVGQVPTIDEFWKSLLFVPYFDVRQNLVQPILSVGWTLNIEMVFYLLFGATMLLSIPVQIVLLGIIFSFAVALRGVFHPADTTVLFFYTTPMTFEFLGGMVIGAAAPRICHVRKTIGVFAGTAGIAMAVGLWWRWSLPRTIDQGIPAMFLVFACIVLEKEIRKANRIWLTLSFLGSASFSIYLTHPLVLFTICPILLFCGLPPLLSGVILFAISVAAGCAVYVWIEQPVNGMLRPKAPRIERPA